MLYKTAITITHDGADYKVPSPDGSEAGSYYTPDRDDAEGTARVMYRFETCASLGFIYRNVNTHPEGA